MATRQSNSVPKRLMTVKEVIATLSLSESKVYQLLAREEIPSVRFGRSVRVDPDDLSSFIEQCKSQSPDFREPSQIVLGAYNESLLEPYQSNKNDSKE